jgi:lipopolysaccharide export system protein LptC
MDRAPSLRVIPWHLAYNWGKGTEKPQLGYQHVHHKQTQYNTQKKNGNTEYYNVTEHWIHNTENSPYQVSKPCVSQFIQKNLNYIITVQYASHQAQFEIMNNLSV